MSLPPLSRRERQIMDALFKLGRASAAEIREAMQDPPGYSAVRAQLRTLEEKGHVRHEADGPRYVYAPVVQADQARRGALRHLVDTFFGGDAAVAAVALLDAHSARLSPPELEQLEAMIARAREEGR